MDIAVLSFRKRRQKLAPRDERLVESGLE